LIAGLSSLPFRQGDRLAGESFRLHGGIIEAAEDRVAVNPRGAPANGAVAKCDVVWPGVSNTIRFWQLRRALWMSSASVD